MPSRIQRYAKRVGIYFWPSVEADALVLDVWSNIPSRERPQDLFRRAVLLGLRQMAANGELPERVLRHNRIGERLARHLPAAFSAPHPVPSPAAHQPASALPAPTSYHPAPADAQPAEPMAFEDGPEEAFDMDAMMRLMGDTQPSGREEAPAG